MDRDSGILAKLFDEDNTAVKAAISHAIKGAHKNGKEVGLCGQAPRWVVLFRMSCIHLIISRILIHTSFVLIHHSDKPEFAGFLVDLGIDSISLTPDSVLKALEIVSKAEMKRSIEKEINGAISAKNKEKDVTQDTSKKINA